MQGLTSFYILLIFTFFFLIRTKDIFHPATLVSCEWLFINFLYNFTNHGLYKLSEKTYLILTLWVIFFSSVSYGISKTNFYIKSKYTVINTNIPFLKKIYTPLLIANILLILAIISAYGANLSYIRNGILKYIPPYVKILFYFNTFSYAYFASICFSNNFSKKKIILFAIIIIITSFFKVNKTTFISFFLLILFVLKEKKLLTLKNFLFLTAITALLVYFVMSLRGDKNTLLDFSIGKYLTIYILSPLTAFNEIVIQKLSIPEHFIGSYNFNFFFKIFSIFSNTETEIFGPWVNVPLPTNVFTVFAPSYIDFGIIGIVIFASLQGFVWGFIYHFVKKEYLIFKIIYGTLLYYLGLQFFSDYFSYSFSVFLQYSLLSIFLVIKIKDFKYLSSQKKENK